MIKKFLIILFFGIVIFSVQGGSLLSTNSTWKYFKGHSEASTPDTTAWRNIGFNDSAWSSGAAPFYYEDDPGPDNPTAYSGNTDLTDMVGGYTCIFMRQTVVGTNVSQVTVTTDGFER